MANVAKLKDRARAFEQREQWKEALEVYRQIVSEGDPEDVDAGIWNRIGDLAFRIGMTESAVEAYDQAVDVYAATGLYNNAIALCRKVLRIAPSRAAVYRKLGRISAAQGFLAEARQNFLEYAQRMQRAGQLDDSFAALAEFADLSPGDTELRLLLAEQLRIHGRESEAVHQLLILLDFLRRSGDEGAQEEVAQRILAIDPEADLSTPELAPEPDAAPDDFRELEFPRLVFEPVADGGKAPPEETLEAALDADLQQARAETDGVEMLEGLETSESYAGDAADPVTPEVNDLAILDLHEEERVGDPGDEEEPAELPLLDFAAPPRDPAAELRARVAAAPSDSDALQRLVGLLDSRGESPAADHALEEAHRALAASGLFADAVIAVRLLMARRPADTVLLQKHVEYAFRTGDVRMLVQAYLDLGRHLGAPAENPKSRAVYQRVMELDPTNAEAGAALTTSTAPKSASGEEYVDLGALILDDEEEQFTTRFVVAEEEPSGDEDRDFAEMLTVFRQKVSENIGTEDSASHYDLGLAFMEMGLIDEAIAEFQVALRGGAKPLSTLEVLGRCFAEKGQFAVASRVFDRALRIPGHGDTEVIGVVYQLARCQEALGDPASAREQYERVVSLDLHFRDAADRLHTLREAVSGF